MRIKWMTFLFFMLTGCLASRQLRAQESFTGINDSVFNLTCNESSLRLKLQVPHLKSSEDYKVTPVRYAPSPYITATGNALPASFYSDDVYSDKIKLPFEICFYDAVYNEVVIGSNGLITFDASNANCQTAPYRITKTIPDDSGIDPCSDALYYPRASIMGVYTDLDASDKVCPPDRKMEWRIEGVAPFRRFVASWYHVGVYDPDNTCGIDAPLSFQIVVNEATAVIDVFIENKACFPATSQGRAILGVQNWARDKGVAADNKNATRWTAQKEGYRFLPSGKQSRFIGSDLLTIGGVYLQTASFVESATEGMLDIQFATPIVPAAASEQYIVRTTYSACNDVNGRVVVDDTITINKSVLPISLTTTETNCAINAGSITATVGTNSGSVAPYTFVLNPGGISNTINTGNSFTFTNLAAGNYTIDASSGSCAGSAIATITSSGTFPIIATPNPPSCAGAPNGSIAFDLPVGGGPYTFTLTGTPKPAVNNVITGLQANSYIAVVTAGPGCTATTFVTVLPGANSLTADVTPGGTSCTGVNNGTINIRATSGSGPYEFSTDNGNSWQTGTNPFTATGLAPGNYTVKVKEGLCISNGYPVTVSAGTGITFTATATATTCLGASDGAITINSATGAAPYTYTIDGTTSQTSNVFTGLAAGTHSITVKDAAGCISNGQSFVITAGPRITGTANAIATTCTGVNNGIITVTTTNGAGPLNFSLDGGSFQSSNVFMSVAAGLHQVVIKNGSGCLSDNIAVTVASGGGITASFVANATACVGVSNGSIVVTPNNGTAPYSYQLDGAAPQLSNTFTGVAAGAHQLVIKDDLGCSSAVINVTVDAGTVLMGNVTTTATSCNGAINGTVTATASNGSAPFQYSIDGGAFQPSNIFNALAAGTHQVIIRDNFGCQSASITAVVANGNALNPTVQSISTTCSGATNGSITVTAPTNGIAPYVYVLSNGTTQSTGLFTGLSNGAYTVVVTDAGGCRSNTIPITVDAGIAVTLSITKTDVSCFNGSNGSIAGSVSANATLPVQYSLDNTIFQPANTFNGLPAASYTMYFKDAAGCANAATVAVAQPALLTATSSLEDVLCNSQSNGLITIAANGGVAPYSYSLNNLNFQSEDSFHVPAGTYTVYVKDANACAMQLSNLLIDQPAAINATATTGSATCDGGADGTITVTATGGTAPYQYATAGVPFQASNVLKVGAGNFIVSVKDANGCTFDLPAVTVALVNNLTLAPLVDPAAVCEGKGVQIQPVTNANQFTWSPSTGISNSAVASPLMSPSVTTTYTLTAILGVCTTTGTVTVSILPAPTPDAGADAEICFGQDYQLQASGGISYTWSPATYLSNSTSPAPGVKRPLQTMRYSLHAVGANGCASVKSDEMVLTVIPPLKVTITPADTVVYAATQFQFNASSAGTNYEWDPAIGLSNPNIANPVVTAPQTGEEILYHVRSSTASGCEGEGTARVRVYEGPDIYMATAFTPNGDGKNDRFIPFPVGIKQLDYFYIFNRWGEMLFSTTRLNEGWDGRFKGAEQGSGVYTWIVKGITADGRAISKKGTVVLIR